MLQVSLLLMMTVAEAAQARPVAKKPVAKPAAAATATKAATPKRAVIAPLTLPANVVPSGPNQWTHTDAQGKEWIYRQGPFGLTRAPKNPTEVTASRLHEGISVVEEGDQVRFSRQGPFGLTQWTKKRDEVNEVERAAMEKARTAKAANQ